MRGGFLAKGKGGPSSKLRPQRTGTAAALRGAVTSSQNGRSTLSERLYQNLKRDIICGVFPPGEALGEGSLAKRYKSSRTPVREAAVRLQQEDLLRIVPNRGYFASSMTINWINEIYEFRAAVEGACAELAARKAKDEDLLDELARLAETEYQPDDPASYEDFIKTDTIFHIGMAQLTRNPMLVRAVSDMRCHMERIMYAAIGIGYYGEAPVKEHSEIIKAIRNHHADLARKLMYEHIIQSRAKVLRIAYGEAQLS
jgi:GntR family transcriptional regulator, rspAB operon transcriptional repressor